MILVLGHEHVCESFLIIPRSCLPFFPSFPIVSYFSSIFSIQAWGGSNQESWRCQHSLSVIFSQVLLISDILFALESPKKTSPFLDCTLDHVQWGIICCSNETIEIRNGPFCDISSCVGLASTNVAKSVAVALERKVVTFLTLSGWML